MVDQLAEMLVVLWVGWSAVSSVASTAEPLAGESAVPKVGQMVDGLADQLVVGKGRL